MPPQTTTTTTTISLHPTTLYSDLHAFATLDITTNFSTPFSSLGFGPQRATPPRIAAWASSLAAPDKPGFRTRHVKAVDGETGKVVGWAGWRFVERGMMRMEDGDEDGDGGKEGDDKRKRKWPEGANERFCEDVLAGGERVLKECVKSVDKYSELTNLVISPTHQRRGLGTRLVLEGLQEVDALRLPCVLMASAEGQLLYETLGFGVLRVLEINYEEYEGGEGMGRGRQVVMWREAVGGREEEGGGV